MFYLMDLLLVKMFVADTRSTRLPLRRPLHKKNADEVVFAVSKVKESRFFKSDLTDPPQFFYSHLLENTNFSPSIFKTLKKFVLPKRCEKNGQFQIEFLCSQS